MSKNALMLWDKMALEVFLISKLNRKAESIIYKKYKKEIRNYYESDQALNSNGAGLFVHAIKE